MDAVSRLSRSRNGGGAFHCDMAHHLSARQGEAGGLRPRRKTRRVWQAAASDVSGYYEVRTGSGSWVDRAAGGLAEFQSVQWPIFEAFRVAVIPGGNEHHLRSAFH